MVLHARFEDIHASLIHSPCLTPSLMLDERLAQSSPCFIVITFPIALYHCLFFYKFSSLPRSDHVDNNSFHAWCMKLSFHKYLFTHDGLRSSELCPFYSGAVICPDFRLHITQCFCHIPLHGSSNSSILDALEPALDGASDFQFFIPRTCLTRSSKFMKTMMSVFEVR
jgi:hypothetical protein